MRKTFLAAALVSAFGAASAAELGALTVYSNVGEPLEAKLEVRDVNPKVEPLLVRLAPSSVYQRVGKDSKVNTRDLTLELESKSPYVVRINGKNPISAKEFPLIVELSEAGRISAKLYTVQLREGTSAAKTDSASSDRTAQAVQKAGTVPSASGAVPSAAAVPAAASVPSVSQKSVTSRSVERVDASTPAAPRTASAAPAANRQVPAASASAASAEAAAQRELEKVRAASAAKHQSAPLASAQTSKSSGSVTLPLDPADYNLDEPFEVRQGMTMWSIAKLYKPRYPQATMDQLLVAFVRDNPRAYDAGRVNGVKVGATLRAPKASTVEKIPVDDAWALVRVNPNANATKAPAGRDLKRARMQIKKQAPALVAQVNARMEREAKSAQERREAKLAAERERQERLAAQKKAEEERAAAAAAAAASSGAAIPSQTSAETPAAADPLAQTIAATSSAPAAQDSSVQSQQPVESSAAVEEKNEQPSEPAPEQEAPAQPEQAEEESSNGMLIGIIIALLAVVGAAVVFLKVRNRRLRDEAALRTVRFMRSEPSSDEQIKGSAQMVQNRMEADRAAARGFNRPAAEKPLTQPQAPQEPSFVSANAAPRSDSTLNVAAAYVADDETAPVPDVLDVKLTNARNYIDVGAYDQAMRLLNEVDLAGNPSQKAQARTLIEQIRAQRG